MAFINEIYKLFDEIDVLKWIMSLKQIQDQIIFANSKYPTGFDKMVSPGMLSSYFFQIIFPLMMEFIVPRNLVARKHNSFYSKCLILLY